MISKQHYKKVPVTLFGLLKKRIERKFPESWRCKDIKHKLPCRCQTVQDCPMIKFVHIWKKLDEETERLQ